MSEKPDYKDTIFLPNTQFPMRAGLPEREPLWLARWEKLGIYDQLRRKTDRPPFVLHDGPPYANGHLHIGHALNKILKDIVVRSRQMLGYDARYIPGWDCHGLPIEWKIEEHYRAQGQSKEDVPVLELRAACRQFAAKWVDIQRDEFKRLGVTGKWDDPYQTMDYHAEAVIAAEFQKFLMNDALYQGSKPVMWSPIEKTALADAEVEYKDKESPAIWVRFRVLEAMDSELVGTDVVIWTTTPWTIPSNKGVVFSNKVSYGVYQITEAASDNWAKIGERLILSDLRAQEIMDTARVTGFVRLGDARDLEGAKLAHPFHGLSDSRGEWDEARILRPAEFVSETEGSGFVHCAPSHGLEDFEFFRDLGLLSEVITYNIEEDGSFRADMPLFGGTRILKPNGKEGDANQAVIAALAEAGRLLARGKVLHSYPHSWRSKAPLIYRNTAQWFVSMDQAVGGDDTYGSSIRARALASIDRLVKFVPHSGRNRLYAMVETRPDWVLSRQRAWGVPLTLFTKKGKRPQDPDYLLRDVAVNQRIIETFEKEGADSWYQEGAKARFLGQDYDPDAYDQVFDVLDVWFDSGSTHAFVLRDRADGSDDGLADLYLEGTDQHRGWFQSSLLESCGTRGRAPYHAVLTHGFTLDEKGVKMSKSLGNTIAPADVIKQYGADILRLWVAMSDYSAEQRIGPEILKGVADNYRKLRNTFRFMLGALGMGTIPHSVDFATMPDLERWVLHRLCELDARVRQGYAEYHFGEVVAELFQFCTLDLSAFYFDVRKDVLYCDAKEDPKRQAALWVMGEVFKRLTTWFAPVLCFTMEEVWLELHPDESASVHLEDFIETPKTWVDVDLAARMAQIRTARRCVTGAIEIERQAKTIGASLEAAPVVYVTDTALGEILRQADFADLCVVSDIEIRTETLPSGAFMLENITGLGVVFQKANGEKCARCWKILPDVGAHSHAQSCARCDTVLGA